MTVAGVASAIQSNTADPNALVQHWGNVISVQASVAPPSITCTIDGGSTPVPGIQFAASYLPLIGDTCFLIRKKSLYIAVNGMASPQSVGSGPAPGDFKITDIPGDEPGWLLQDGRSLLIATYPNLAAVLIPTYGGADGLHFNLPNRQGRYIVGAGGGYTVGTLTGSTTIQPQNLPSTSPWQANDPGHFHGAGTTFFLETGGTGGLLSAGSGAQAVTNTGTHTAGVTMGTNTAGGGTAYDLPNAPAYVKSKT